MPNAISSRLRTLWLFFSGSPLPAGAHGDARRLGVRRGAHDALGLPCAGGFGPAERVAREERHHEVDGEGAEQQRGGHDAVVLAADEAREQDRQHDDPDPAHHAADLHPGAHLRVADAQRAFLHEGRAEARQQPCHGRHEVAEQRQPRDQHERRRREHQAHVEVSQEDHVRREARGAGPRGRWQRARRGAGGRERECDRRRQRAAGPAPGVPARERRAGPGGRLASGCAQAGALGPRGGRFRACR